VVRTVGKVIREWACVASSSASTKGHPEEPSVSRFGANQGKDFIVADKLFCSLPPATVLVKSFKKHLDEFMEEGSAEGY